VAPITWQALLAFFSGDYLELDGELERPSAVEPISPQDRVYRERPFGVAGTSLTSL
jgi:hypothetical protein